MTNRGTINPNRSPRLRALRSRLSANGCRLLILSVLLLSSCSRPPSDPSSVVFVIESNPANLDPRFGSDAQSQRLSALLFDGLVERDAEMNLHPDLAASWDTPTPLTYIFHLRKGISFHDGRPVTCMSR